MANTILLQFLTSTYFAYSRRRRNLRRRRLLLLLLLVLLILLFSLSMPFRLYQVSCSDPCLHIKHSLCCFYLHNVAAYFSVSHLHPPPPLFLFSHLRQQLSPTLLSPSEKMFPFEERTETTTDPRGKEGWSGSTFSVLPRRRGVVFVLQTGNAPTLPWTRLFADHCAHNGLEIWGNTATMVCHAYCKTALL